jgi:hypothetical protein
VLNTSGVENLLTICHGDAKPGNFMSRTVETDDEDTECGGMESVLFDWQAGFLGCSNIWSILCHTVI